MRHKEQRKRDEQRESNTYAKQKKNKHEANGAHGTNRTNRINVTNTPNSAYCEKQNN